MNASTSNTLWDSFAKMSATLQGERYELTAEGVDKAEAIALKDTDLMTAMAHKDEKTVRKNMQDIFKLVAQTMRMSEVSQS